jgi:TRAP-type C4-dicarboxylate transport system permease small subunit
VKNAETIEKQPVEAPATAAETQTEITGESAGPPMHKRSGIALLLQAVTGHLSEGAGHLAAATLLVLTLSIVLGIALRVVNIDNSWTYDLSLFALAWLSFIGAVLTSLRDHHVTAGIALENLLGGRGTLLAILRFVIVAAFLVMLTISGYREAHSSFLNSETTLDVVQWPVWVAKTALPVGAALWLVAETHKLFRRFTGSKK